MSHIFSEQFDAPVREAAAPCHLDSTCYPDWQQTARSVARLVYERDGGSYLCSGTLLNTRNSSFVPFFLTANHCMDNDAVARTVQAFWFYQAGQCNGTPPNPRDLPRSNGATLLATGDENQGDFTLLRLTSVPDGVFFSGWRPEEVALDTPLIGIHHPAGDYRRISFGARTAGPSATGLLAPGVAYTVRWNEGHTEGGSSGSGLFAAPGVLVGSLTGGLRAPAGGTKCDINPDFSFYGRFSSYYPTIRDFLEDRTTTPASPPPPSAGVITLASGASQSFNLAAVTNASLLSSPSYRIEVPAGAARLVVRMTTSTPGVDTDLFVRFGSAPVVSGGRVSADHSSATAGGDETVIITPNSVPALRAGTYFISIGLFTTGTQVQGAITATVESGTSPPPAGTPNQLTSGVPATFSFPAISNNGTLFNPPYTVVVPQGASRLTVRVVTNTPNADIDVFVRFNASPEIQNQRIVADHVGDSVTGNETVVISSTSTPALRAGTYFISLALFTNGVAVQGTVTATVEGGGGGTNPPPATGVTPLTSGASVNFSLPSVTGGTFFNTPMFSIQVPQGATRLTVRLTTNTPNADVDVFIRRNTQPVVENRVIIADHKGESTTGNETVVITPTSTPALQAGTYYIGLGLFTNGVAVTGSLSATVESGGGSPPPSPGQPTTLTSGVARNFQLPSISSPTLFNAASSMYTIQVPQNASRLTIRLTTSTPDADVDLFARFGSAPEIASS
ncbi:MAG: PPC domain-containing protein, partial [Bryobacteraceae bacterium]|nr:PPC domain-containing protein [Bryobacteraceae bacterium]